MKEINLQRIAELAQVSKTTVSYVFNHHPGIAEKTRNKVLAVAKKYNYKPNYFAQALNTGKTRTIGVLFTNALGVFMGDIVKGIEDVIYKHGFHALICTCNNDQKREKKHLEVLLHKGVDGIIAFFVTEKVKGKNAYKHWLDLKRKGIPLVFIDRYLSGEDIDYVACDDFAGAYQAVMHLVKSGYRKIAHVTKDDNCTAIQNRLEGYLKALADSGIEINRNYIVKLAPPDYKAGKAVRQLGKMKDRPDAIFAASYPVTIDVFGVLKDEDLNVPRDIAVVGFGDSQECAVMTPALTTVRQPQELLGKTAAEILLRKLNSKKEVQTEQIMLKTELVIRESCGNMKNAKYLSAE